MDRYDVIVAGGGIAGLSTAYHLVTAGARTLVIDRDDAGKATAAGAGILAPETGTHEAQAWFDLALPAVEYYPVLMERLKADDAGETGYALASQLTVSVSEDEDAAYQRARQRILARRQQRGRPSASELAEIDAAEAQRRFPPLAPVRHALFYQNAARVDGRLIAAALRRAAEQHKLSYRQASVDRLVIEDNAVTGVTVIGEAVQAGAVVIAGGAWSAQFGEQLQLSLPVAPQRGQIIHLRVPGATTASWPIINAFHGHYIVPWPDGRVAVGATRETGSGFAPYTTVAGVQEVLREALRVAPGLADATIADMRVGLRPATPDNLPVLGPVPGVRNVYLATGYGATGLQLGPYSGKLIADMIAGRQLDVDLAPFSVTRFNQV